MIETSAGASEEISPRQKIRALILLYMKKKHAAFSSRYPPVVRELFALRALSCAAVFPCCLSNPSGSRRELDGLMDVTFPFGCGFFFFRVRCGLIRALIIGALFALRLFLSAFERGELFNQEARGSMTMALFFFFFDAPHFGAVETFDLEIATLPCAT